MIRYRLEAGLIIIMVLTTGCMTLPAANGVEVSYSGDFNTTAEFQMKGQIVTGGGVPESERFNSVVVQLYASDGTLICAREVGTISADYSQQNISISAKVIPQYILIISPDFWSSPTRVSYYQYDSDQDIYIEEVIDSRQSLPVVPKKHSNQLCKKA